MVSQKVIKWSKEGGYSDYSYGATEGKNQALVGAITILW